MHIFRCAVPGIHTHTLWQKTRKRKKKRRQPCRKYTKTTYGYTQGFKKALRARPFPETIPGQVPREKLPRIFFCNSLAAHLPQLRLNRQASKQTHAPKVVEARTTPLQFPSHKVEVLEWGEELVTDRLITTRCLERLIRSGRPRLGSCAFACPFACPLACPLAWP